jgi:hypothetical protein
MTIGATTALICLAAVVLYCWHVQTARAQLTICRHCGDVVYAVVSVPTKCPHCKKWIAG